MKKIFLLLIVVLIVSAFAVAAIEYESHPIVPMPTEAADLPPISQSRAAAEDMGRETLRTYILARLSMEKLAKEEEENAAADLAATLQETTKYWSEARSKAQSLRETASAEEEGSSKISLRFSLMNHAYASMPVDRKREEALTEERKKIIEAYASYPYSRNLKILAAQIEQDADTAASLLARIEGGEISCREAAAELSENCRIAMTARSLGGKLQYVRPEGHEAFAWFWGDAETFAAIAPEGSRLLLDRVTRIVFIVNDTGILMGDKALSTIDVDEFLAAYSK